MSRWPAPSLRHVARLTDEVGIVEHARLAVPRRDLGYCTDDAGRALAVAVRVPEDPDAERIATASVEFLARASRPGGGFRLRLGPGGWSAESSDDATGRALLGLGAAAARAPWTAVRARAAELFATACRFDSPHVRAMAYAALGAAELLAAVPGQAEAARLLERAASRLPGRAPRGTWSWPEARLSYANALLPEALLAVGSVTGDDPGWGLALLDWLVQEERIGDRFSFTPVGGRGPADAKPGFDQQPIEAWAMADACARAHAITADPRWLDAVDLAAAWFVGGNDVGVAVFDPVTGGGFDGLEPTGVNRNEGAESTLAFVATMAQVRAVGAGQAASSSAASASRSSR